ncbi:MAG: HAD family phosphatase [Lachnospiraceae bacterium]|nr:HAD family phosphatase [Lachnospiraceae bacterium]
MSDFKIEDIIGVIFDFNGTMFFDSEKHVKAWSLYIEELIGTKLSDSDIEQYVKALPGRKLIEHYLGYDISDDMYEQLSEEKENIYRRLCIEDKENLKLAPGLEKFLDYLTEYNIPRTIATTAPMSNVMFYFETFDLYRWFDTDKLVFHDKRLRDKPYPDQYLVACKMIDKEPGKCMVFEDSESGIQSATAAGIKYIIAVNGDNLGLETKDYETVKVVIRDYEELGEDFELPS